MEHVDFVGSYALSKGAAGLLNNAERLGVFRQDVCGA